MGTHKDEATGGSTDPEVHALLADLYNRFIHMLLHARVGLTRWTAQDELISFAIFHGEPPLVQINDEPEVWAIPRAKRSFSSGEVIHPDDLLTESAALSIVDGRPFVRARQRDAVWEVEFNLHTPSPRAQECLRVADEFVAAARWAFEHDLTRVFIENAFHATEALAKAELLSYPVAAVEVEDSRKHKAVLSAYHLWARLGNTDSRFATLLQRLFEERGAATYGDQKAERTAADPAVLLETLLELRQHLEDIAQGKGPQIITVIATKEIQAYTMVTNADATIRPLRPKKLGDPTAPDGAPPLPHG